MSDKPIDFFSVLDTDIHEHSRKEMDESLTGFPGHIKETLEAKLADILKMVANADESLNIHIQRSLERTDKTVADYLQEVETLVKRLEIPAVPAAPETPPASKVALPSPEVKKSSDIHKGALSVAICAVLCIVILMGTGWVITYQVSENNRLQERNAKLLKDARTIEEAIRIMRDHADL